MAKKAAGKPSTVAPRRFPRNSNLFKPIDPAPEVIAALYPDEPAAPLPEPEQNKSLEPTGPQISRAIRAARSIWTPDGKPPAGMLLETARGKVNALLADESQHLGLGEISPDTMKRAIDYLRSL